MDLHDAIEAHVDLHKEVTDYAGKRVGSLDAVTVERTDQCDLGKWLPEEGAKHQALPEYGKLIEAHGAFHVACANVVKAADEGTLDEEALGQKGALYAALVDFCYSTSKLNVKIQ